jgi:hypothetical protein
MIRHLPFILIACCFLKLGMTSSSATDDDRINSALPAALAWVAQIDAGNYDDSYLTAGVALHEKVKQDQWDLVLKTIRPPWGNVVSRKVISHVYKPDGVSGLNGECMVITYATSFKKLDSGFEVVVLQWEDGQWRGVGYRAGPKSTPTPTDQPPPESQTDVQTTTIPGNHP